MLHEADLNCPDSKPLSLIGRYLYGDAVGQVPGPDFMPEFCQWSAETKHTHFLYGGAPGVARAASRRLEELFPGIGIGGTFSPPYRELTPEEDDAVCKMINDSSADIVWVSLGCPKQEKWMYDHRERLNAKVLLGVGQAVDILAGETKRAPSLLQRAGLEWGYRLVLNPRRLWRRYLATNAVFIFWLLRNLRSYRHLKQVANNLDSSVPL